MVMLCWSVPVLLMLGVIGYYLFSNHFDEKVENQLKHLTFNNEICAERLNSLVKISKQATRDGKIEKAFKQYQKGTIDRRSLLDTSSSYLRETYGENVKIKDAILWFYEDPEKMQCEKFNKGAEGSWQEINIYWNEDHEEIYEYAKTLDISIGFYSKDERVYLIRNLVDYAYRPMGTLVLRINRDYCFDKVSSFPTDTDVMIRLNSVKFRFRVSGLMRKKLS